MKIKATSIAILLSLTICTSAFAAATKSNTKPKTPTKTPGKTTAKPSAKTPAKGPAATKTPANTGQRGNRSGQGFAGLNLTEKQRKDIAQIAQSHQKSTREINSSSATATQKENRIKKQKADTTAKLKKALTAKQFEEAQKSGALDWMLSANTGNRGRNNNNYEALDLTAQQKTKIEAITKEQSKKMQAIRSNDKLTREQQMQKTRSIAEETEKSIMGVLTAAQKKKFEEMKKSAPNRQNGPRMQGPGRQNSGRQAPAGSPSKK